ncbi:MAG: putative glycosyltransferase EpsE [Bacteroidota bacterium]|jgi:glycosyltransferase involved in cell wall biosynthesis
MRSIEITIGMPVFNDIDFIEESLKSILSQTFDNFKLIISDDGSTDGCEDICRKYAQSDHRIEYIRQPKNLGISKNMEFLLSKAETPYFMWAADDDLWSENYISKLIALLELDNDAVCAFCDYYHIDEVGKKISPQFSFNYNRITSYSRLNYFIKNADDGFGYGVFRTKKIKDVKFPIWKWPNKKTAYNNIFPSLCFYLAKGQYLHIEEPLFFKRVKTKNKVNHVLSGEGNAIIETFTYIMRRLNLVGYSSRLIFKAKGFVLFVSIYPTLFYYWFIKSSFKQIRLAGSSFVNNRIFRKKISLK